MRSGITRINFSQRRRYIGTQWRSSLNTCTTESFFYSYDYLRYHSIVADEVIEADLAVPVKTKPDGRPVSARLSSVDTLMIAMGIELNHVHRQPVWLLTKDIRARDVAREFPKKLIVRDWPGLTADRLPR